MNKIFLTFFCTVIFLNSRAMDTSTSEPKLLCWQDLKSSEQPKESDYIYINKANHFISAHYSGDSGAAALGTKLLREVAFFDTYIEITKILLAAGIDANATISQKEINGYKVVQEKLYGCGITHNPLYNSSRYAPNTMELLLENGATPDVQIEDDHLFSPAHNILRSSYFWGNETVTLRTRMLDLLVQHKANLNLKDENGRTPFQMVSHHAGIRDMPTHVQQHFLEYFRSKGISE